MRFQQDCPKDKENYSSFNFLPENLEKYRSTGLYGASLEGSTIFLCRSSLGCTSMESCQLAELKYAILSSTGCKTKNITALEALSIDGLLAWAPRGIDIRTDEKYCIS